MSWYVGQKVVALQSTPISGLVKDSIYTIVGLSQCKCGLVNICVGKLVSFTHMVCETCKYVEPINNGLMYHDEYLFAPIEPKHELSTTTYEDIMEEIEELELQTA